MTRSASNTATRKTFGVSAIEILLIGSAIGIFSALTPFWIGKAAKPSGLDEAVRTVEDSVHRARQTARIYQTEVVMQVGVDAATDRQQIVLSIPGMRPTDTHLEVEETIALPPGFLLVSDDHVIRFDARGNPQPVVRATVVAADSKDQRRDLLIF